MAEYGALSLLSATERVEQARAATARSHAPRYMIGGRSRVVWMWVGDIIITLSVILGMFVFWQMVWSNVQSDRVQHALSDDLRSQWESGGSSGIIEHARGDAAVADVSRGDAFGYLYIPALGQGWSRAIVSGVDQASLAAGPGFYPASQAPGVIGNTAIAGHRDGQGAPFHDLDRMNTCDTIVIETQQRWLTYKVLPVDNSGGAAGYVDQMRACVPEELLPTLGSGQYSGIPGRSIVSPEQVDVVSPIPRDIESTTAQAQMSMVTLTTCHPIWSNRQRLIIHAVLVDNTLKEVHPDGWIPEEIAA